MSIATVAAIGALAGIALAVLLVASARRRQRAGRPLPGAGPEGRGMPRVEHALEAAVWVLGALALLVAAALLGLLPW